jgi:putative oxidoreductase
MEFFNRKETETMIFRPAILDNQGTKPIAPFLVRMIVGCVFLSEGIQKFLFSESLGVGRFIRIGIPAPEIMAPFVGVVEIVCGLLVLLGLFTQLASIPLIINILVAICSTKIPILLEKGFWAMAHEARTDWSMLLGSIFLLLVGAGRWSLDALLVARSRRESVS